MAKIYNYDVMFDDTSIDVSKEVALVWSIANSLRGAYTSDKYKDVIIPMVILRRFECALAETKKAVVDKYKANPKLPAALLEKASGYPFYNTSEFTLARLLNDSDNIAENFVSYIESFSANVQTIFNNLDFKKQIEKMDKNNRLYGVVKKFSEIDFDPNQEDQAENVDKFIRQAKKYLYLEKLTPTILNDMVNAVYVHAPDKSSGHRVQDVTISYNYIGILPANLLYDVMNGKAA